MFGRWFYRHLQSADGNKTGVCLLFISISQNVGAELQTFSIRDLYHNNLYSNDGDSWFL